MTRLVVDLVGAAEIVEREVEGLLGFAGVPRDLRRCTQNKCQSVAQGAQGAVMRTNPRSSQVRERLQACDAIPTRLEIQPIKKAGTRV